MKTNIPCLFLILFDAFLCSCIPVGGYRFNDYAHKYEIEYRLSQENIKQKFDFYLLNSTDFPWYRELKDCNPEILNMSRGLKYLPDSDTKLLRFSNNDNAYELKNASYIVGEDKIIPIGTNDDGFGVTEFVIVNGRDLGNKFYFMHSTNKPSHVTNVYVYLVNKEKLFKIKDLEFENAYNYTFEISSKGLNICKAIIEARWDSEGFPTFSISKGEIIYKNINEFETIDFKKTRR